MIARTAAIDGKCSVTQELEVDFGNGIVPQRRFLQVLRKLFYKIKFNQLAILTHRIMLAELHKTMKLRCNDYDNGAKIG